MSGVRVPAPPPFHPPAARLRRLEPVLRRALRGPCATPRGTRLLVAVSGGADSTALLLALASLRSELGLELAAAHLHHGLRGRDADRDLAHVRELCRRLGVPLIAARWDTRARMKRRALSGQGGLRTLRREFLLAACRSANAASIATAHTADDQLETVLMRWLRGAGLRGLAGMRPRSGPWLKPLLEATRTEVEADLRALGETWREDASNADTRYLRSRIRHAVIPALLEAHGRGASRAALARGVSASVRELRDAGRALDSRARRLLARHGGAGEDQVWAERSALVGAPRAVRSAAVRMLWSRSSASRSSAPRASERRIGERGVGLTRRHLDALLSLAASGAARSRVALPDRRVALLRGGRLLIVRERASETRGRALRRNDKLPRPRRSARAGETPRTRRSLA